MRPGVPRRIMSFTATRVSNAEAIRWKDRACDQVLRHDPNPSIGADRSRPLNSEVLSTDGRISGQRSTLGRISD
jgi:hypothetical protein